MSGRSTTYPPRRARRRRGRGHLRRERAEEGGRGRARRWDSGSSPTIPAWRSTPSAGRPACTRPGTRASRPTTRRTTASSSEPSPKSPTKPEAPPSICHLALADPAGTDPSSKPQGACRGRIIRGASRATARLRLRPAVPHPRIPQDVRRTGCTWPSTSSATDPGPSGRLRPALDRLIASGGDGVNISRSSELVLQISDFKFRI